MAESLIGGALKSLLPLVGREVATFAGIRQKAEKLKTTLDLIKAYLDDAEEKQMTSPYVKAWLQQLKDAVYVLEDVLADCSHSNESLQLGGLCSFTLDKIIFRWWVGRRLNQMIVRLDQIFEEKNKFADRIILSNHVRQRPTEVPEWRQTSATIASPQIYGRVEDKKRIVDILLGPAQDSDSVSVYPIIGLGGMGKTTLTQLVYNDQSVSDHFNLKIWVCVSENFDIRSILRSIIENVKKERCNVMDLNVMEERVKDLLQSKRYLLVLDDIWKRSQQLEFGLNHDKWDKLRSVLSCGSKGASILVTTRDEDVASIMGTCQAHDLSQLSEDDCWALFKQRAFGRGKEEREELVAIGKEIAKKCKGSPLAAQALGGLMRSRRGEKEWLEVKESKLWSLPDENDIFRALRLSYLYLTPTSKQCFVFCAIFPKDVEIKKHDLIHLWMANGFISSRDNLDAEEVGNMIWNDLHQKSFFQDVKIYDDLGNICFKMHDLVHDLAQSITAQECMCFEKAWPVDLSRNIHHIGFGCGGETSFKMEALENVESMRTLYQLNYDGSPAYSWFPTNRSLRALRICSSELSSLGHLIHLRYFELYHLKIKTLPDSICNLRKLEILKLTELHELSHLPKHMACLQSLRHLVIRDCYKLSCMFPNIHQMTRLRTLTVYIVKMEAGHSLAELRNLNLLGGDLTIEELGNVGSLTEAQEANLKGKGDIQRLYLSWKKRGETKSHAVDAGQVLEALQPHSNLKVLGISYYEGLHLPSWTGNISVLNNLVSLQLYECKNCLKLPPLSKLSSLKELKLYRMDNVQYLDDDDDDDDDGDGRELRAFPSLEELTLLAFPKLERLMKMQRRDMFPCLSSLKIYSCPKLQLQHLPRVKSLTVVQCNNELLRAISSFNTLESIILARGEEVTSFPEGMMNNMTGLKTLHISGLQKLKELPGEITKLSRLESLTIDGCNELESLPEQGMEDLCSLTTLRIQFCKGLRSLPEGIRHLTSLQVLIMSVCSEELKERCKEGTGEEWHKISHIPDVYID